jgi:uncharacterized protein YaeQ
LTVAQHPSETIERMIVRILVFCLHSFDDSENLLAFTKGLSSVDDPDIWQKTLDDQLLSWIDVGEPSFDRMKKACRLAKNTFVYSFNTKSDVWWKQNKLQFETLPIQFFAFQWPQIQALAKQVERKSSWSITISDDSLYVSTAIEQLEMNWRVLK